jgi:hypothetical protein
MWIPCPRVLDEPVKILGLEVEDLVVSASVPLLLGIPFDLGALPCFAGAGVLGLVLYRAKRGKAPGALLHALHRLELAKLPGVLSPRPRTYSPW